MMFRRINQEQINAKRKLYEEEMAKMKREEDLEKLRGLVGHGSFKIEQLRDEIDKVKEMNISEAAKSELEIMYLVQIEEIKTRMRETLAKNRRFAENMINTL